MKNIKAVIFDLDNTLADRKHAYSHHARVCAEKFLKDKSLAEEFIKRLTLLDNNGYSSKSATYDTIYGEFPLLGSPDEMSNMWNENAMKYTVPEPYAEDILEYLGERGYITALLTNGLTKTQNLKLDSAGLRKYFSEILVSEEAGTQKPDKRIFLMICEKIKVSPENCLYVGDHIENDYFGALNAGLKAVLYDKFFAADEKINKIHSLSDLKEIL